MGTITEASADGEMNKAVARDVGDPRMRGGSANGGVRMSVQPVAQTKASKVGATMLQSNTFTFDRYSPPANDETIDDLVLSSDSEVEFLRGTKAVNLSQAGAS